MDYIAWLTSNERSARRAFEDGVSNKSSRMNRGSGSFLGGVHGFNCFCSHELSFARKVYDKAQPGTWPPLGKLLARPVDRESPMLVIG